MRDEDMDGEAYDPAWESIARELRREPRVDPAAVGRVLAAVARDASAPRLEAVPGGALARAARWMREPRTVRVTPAGALAAAAAVVVLALAPWMLSRAPSGVAPAPVAAGVPAPEPDAPARAIAASDAGGGQRVQFTLTVPSASQVSLVGDFNDWDASATPLRQSASGGVWTVVVPLAPGRHRYAFVVNGKTWIADEEAPRAPDGEFDTPSSVVLVGERDS